MNVQNSKLLVILLLQQKIHQGLPHTEQQDQS